MKKMNFNRTILSILLGTILVGCETDILNNKIDTSLKLDQVFVNYDRIVSVGNAAYTYLPGGFYNMGGSLLAGATDEAENTYSSSSVQYFNIGGWNQFYNPDDTYNQCYQGIRAANFFLENTNNYKQIILRDTFNINGKITYNEQCNDIAWLRAENIFLKAFFNFELLKKYGNAQDGGIVIVNNILKSSEATLTRDTYSNCVDYIVSLCNEAELDLQPNRWEIYRPAQMGRAEKGVAKALKSRVLLYAASKLNNPDNNLSKWEAAAKAAYDVISMGKYQLDNSYSNLFVAPNSWRSPEVIFCRHFAANNYMETLNYPIGTQGGKSGTCPSQNLVGAYEHLAGWDAAKPYEKVDPRLMMTVVVNNSVWTGRKIECWKNGGYDGASVDNSTRTGYYLKKFLQDNIDLNLGKTTQSAWIYMRYAEILLNYAEAMNEAYGPDADPKGYGKTARQAVNEVRNRTGVYLPNVVATNKAELFERIKHERRIELAFEEHRYWDARRWKEGPAILGADLKGMDIVKNKDNSFTYKEVILENRVWDDSKMNSYPIPQSEINSANGKLTQNAGWE